MDGELTGVISGEGTYSGFATLPALITDADERARSRFLEFFIVTLHNKDTHPDRDRRNNVDAHRNHSHHACELSVGRVDRESEAWQASQHLTNSQTP
jgi:hypothetical protein